MKKVSVIIPIYNSEKYIEQCINSVINQTYKNLEIIVVDDNSTDNSLNKIKNIKDKRIKIIELKNNYGVSTARNKGIDASTGDYICFIDSDDYWNLKKIEKQIKFIKDKEFIYAGYRILKNKHTHNVNVPKTITYKEALKNTTIFTSTVMFNMKYLKKEDIYMPNVKRGQDTLCWWKVLKKINTAYGMDEILSIYRVGNPSLSSNKITALIRTWKIYKIEKIKLPKRINYFIHYVINAIKRRI